MNPETGRQQRRQDEARHRCRCNQSGNGVQAELCQTGKAGQQQRGKAEDRGQHAEADGGPVALEPVLTIRAVLFRLHKQVDGIIHRFADQGGAKPQRDAVHLAKAQADRRNARQRAADHGQQAQSQRAE